MKKRRDIDDYLAKKKARVAAAEEAAELATLIEDAKTFPDAKLIETMVETMDRAIGNNNSGLFRVAGILMDEIDRRGLTNVKIRNYRDLLRMAVTEAEQRH